MRKQFFLTLGLISMMAVGCTAQPTVEDAQATYCQNLARLEQAIANFRGLSANSTVDDLKEATDRVKTAYNDVKASAADLKTVKVDALDQAYNDLDKAIRDVPNNATLGEAAASLQGNVQAVDDARATLDAGAQCN